MRNTLLIALALLPLTSPAAESPAAAYFGNSLLCKSAKTGAVCELWLDESGKYAVFYDSGKKAFVTGVNGPFQNEGRQGTYTAKAGKDGLKLCLKPETDKPPRPKGASPALFHDAGCLTLPAHAVGELWDFTWQGETYKMGLIKGR